MSGIFVDILAIIIVIIATLAWIMICIGAVVATVWAIINYAVMPFLPEIARIFGVV